MFGSTFCDEFLDLGGGYGVKYMHASFHPSDLSVFAPWRGSAEHFELMRSMPRTGGYGILQRCREAGEIVVGKDGLPTPIWHLSDFDRGVMRKGLDGLAQILEAGGARLIYSSHAGWVSYEPGKKTREDFMRAADAGGWDAAQVTLGAFHLMVTAHMGSSRDRRVQPRRRGVGCAQPLRGRRRGAADRPRGEPDDHDRGGGAQDRPRHGREACMTLRKAGTPQ